MSVHDGHILGGGAVGGSLELFAIGAVAAFFLAVGADVLGMSGGPGVGTQQGVVGLAVVVERGSEQPGLIPA